jgi:hypothetical protein
MGSEHRCQRVLTTTDGRERCPLGASWSGWAHAGREIYVVEACDRHQSGLIDAEPLDGDWDRRPVQVKPGTPS